MNKDKLKLIYVNHVGSNWKYKNVYEFIFSEDTSDDIEGDDWDVYPAANGNVTPPQSEFVEAVGLLETEIDLFVIRDSDKFSVLDSLDGIVPLAYENIEDYDEYPEDRLAFHFGITMNEVTKNFYSREIILEYKQIKK